MRTEIAGVRDIVTLAAPKDPSDKLLYEMDWSAFLTPLADTVSTSAWDGGGLTASAATPAIATDGLHTYAWLEGGAAGTVHAVRNTITTANGRTVTRSFRLLVEDR
jgi:hypothetical protein